MTFVGDLLSSVFERRIRLMGPANDDGQPIQVLIKDLVGTAGEISGQNLGRVILNRYAAMDDAAKLAFFHHLAKEMAVDPQEIRVALNRYEAEPTRATYQDLKSSVRPTRVELIGRLNKVPGATGQLVAMRRDLLRLGKGDKHLAALDLDFRQLFSAWFNRGFLVLRPITWESPAHILEKIITYEAVHAIDSWEELRRRLQPVDRRCYAFFHPAMADEPLIFVEVALTKGVPGSIQDLLSEERDEIDDIAADNAVFYSISNCQSGLANISFGNSLIKQVAAELAQELPALRTFVTLSPIPGLQAWLQSKGAEELMSDDQRRALAAYYLIKAKRHDGSPRDPVARFHLGNGAKVHKLHVGADTSAKGIEQSGGVMVNYLYDLARVAKNHEGFAVKGVVATSPEARGLAESGRKLLAAHAMTAKSGGDST